MRDEFTAKKSWYLYTVFFLFLFLFSGSYFKAIAEPLPSSALIDNAYQQGKIGADKQNLYKAYLSFSPEKLPKEFQSDASEKCGTSLRKQSLQYLSTLDDGTKARYKLPLHIYSYDTLAAPSTYGLDKTYETEHFIIWYTTSGSNAPSLTDSNGNNVPDFIENAGTYAETSYAYQVTTLGYKKPPITTIPKYYLYIANYASGVYGVTFYGYFPGNSGNQLDILFIIHNNFSFARKNDDPDGTVLGALKVTVVHEFYHGVQAAYDWFEDEANGFWFAEASATWMEDEVYPDTNDYIGYLSSWFASNGVALDSSSNLHQYGSAIFCKFLSEKVAGAGAGANPVIMKYIWEEAAVNEPNGGKSVNSITNVLQSKYAATFSEVIKNFYVTNYLKDYADGAKFPSVRTTDYTATSVNLTQSSLSHLAAVYYSYQSSSKKTLALQFDGSDDSIWSAVLVKEAVSSKTQENLTLDSTKKDGYKLISDFGDPYTKVAAVLVNATNTGLSKYDYQSSTGGFGTNPALTAPSNLQIIYGTGKTTLTWTAGSGELSGYKIYRSASSGSGYTLLAIIGTQTSYEDTFLQKEKPAGQTTFYYTITSYNADGESFASKEKNVVITSSSLTKTYNAPNPFSTKTTIYVTFQGDSPVSAALEIYTTIGKRIGNYFISSSSVPKKGNMFAYTLDGIDFPSGVYIYRLTFYSFDGTTSSAIGKFVVIR